MTLVNAVGIVKRRMAHLELRLEENDSMGAKGWMRTELEALERILAELDGSNYELAVLDGIAHGGPSLGAQPPPDGPGDGRTMSRPSEAVDASRGNVERLAGV